MGGWARGRTQRAIMPAMSIFVRFYFIFPVITVAMHTDLNHRVMKQTFCLFMLCQVVPPKLRWPLSFIFLLQPTREHALTALAWSLFILHTDTTEPRVSVHNTTAGLLQLTVSLYCIDSIQHNSRSNLRSILRLVCWMYGLFKEWHNTGFSQHDNQGPNHRWTAFLCFSSSIYHWKSFMLFVNTIHSHTHSFSKSEAFIQSAICASVTHMLCTQPVCEVSELTCRMQEWRIFSKKMTWSVTQTLRLAFWLSFILTDGDKKIQSWSITIRHCNFIFKNDKM